VIHARIEMATKEIQRTSEYDYLIINDDLREASDLLRIIAKAARLKVSSHNINEFTRKWEDI
jgi:guanylate kinase